MNRDEVESQLSAMFDGELPAAECELLSRRLVREEPLRATWSRYAVIGAALRAEPVARVRPDFARQISAQLAAQPGRLAAARRGRFWRSAVMGSALAAGVAGVAIMVLRSDLPLQPAESLEAFTPTVVHAAAPQAARLATPAVSFGRALSGGEPASYVVPPNGAGNNLALPASLADYVVAHSAVSSPLMRRSLVSTLIGNETVLPDAVPEPPAGNVRR